ncbi:MAG: hypothetical protein OXG05_11045 [Gammaproteobacteria bacterium]|nr:hypothetical protein [Gammaproteobacteria bacterium]
MTGSISSKESRYARWHTVSMLGAATWLITSPWGDVNGEEALLDLETEDQTSVSQVRPLIGAVREREGEGEGGEGEGGEGEGVGGYDVDLSTNDVAYLSQLGLIRGHLAVGFALYQHDLAVLAETHMKHPREEIYSTVIPAFEARGCDGFGSELTELTRVVTKRASMDEVSAVYDVLTGAINTCEQLADITNPIVISKIIENLLRTAGVEYQIGVVDGTIDNLHEYQDAWGFTQIAGNWAQSDAFATSATATAVAGQLQNLIAGLDTLWPSLDPQDVSDGDASRLFGAAGQVEATAMSLQR